MAKALGAAVFNRDRRQLLLLAVFLFLVWLAGRQFSLDRTVLQRSLAGMPVVLSGIVFIVLYVVFTFFLWFSKDLFRLAAALVFGPVVSTVLVLCGELGNCGVLFFLSRKMGRRCVEKETPGWARRLYAGSGGLGFGWLLLLRCAPLVPFRFLDLAAGLSAVSFRKYFTAALIGSPLRIFWLQFVLAGIGSAVVNPDAAAVYFSRHPGILMFSLIYLAFMIAALSIIKKRERVCR